MAKCPFCDFITIGHSNDQESLYYHLKSHELVMKLGVHETYIKQPRFEIT